MIPDSGLLFRGYPVCLYFINTNVWIRVTMQPTAIMIRTFITTLSTIIKWMSFVYLWRWRHNGIAKLKILQIQGKSILEIMAIFQFSFVLFYVLCSCVCYSCVLFMLIMFIMHIILCADIHSHVLYCFAESAIRILLISVLNITSIWLRKRTFME